MLPTTMKNCLLFVIWAMPLTLVAQNKEKRSWSWGFFSGLDHHSLGIETIGRLDQAEPRVWSDGARAGGSAGLLLRKQVLPWLEFLPGMGLSMVNNVVQYRPDGPRIYRFYDFEIPLHVQFTDARKANAPLRACILAGPRFSWNLADNPSDFLKINQERFAADLGLGVQIKLKNWSIQPVFIYSHGLNDLHFPDQGKYDDLVGRVVRDKFSLRIQCWRNRK